MIALGRGAEFDRIRAIAAVLGDDSPIGDDCAVLPDGAGRMLVSTDLSVEGVHFRPGWLSLEEIGWRAAASALSDLAAMGAIPAAVVTTLGLPASMTDDDVAAIMAGIDAVSRSLGAAVIGGDLSEASELSVGVTVIGRASDPVWRSGAHAGDGLWVTGMLGGAATAVAEWKANEPVDGAARAAFARPEPRIAAGRWLASEGATAMIDLSDGLAGDVAHLAAASGLRAVVDVTRVPVHPGVIAWSVRHGVEPCLVAARGGEDYELLVALPPAFSDAHVRRFEHATGLALSRVGGVKRGRGVEFRLRGERIALDSYAHFT